MPECQPECRPEFDHILNQKMNQNLDQNVEQCQLRFMLESVWNHSEIESTGHCLGHVIHGSVCWGRVWSGRESVVACECGGV